MTFEAILYERTNQIKFQYLQTSFGSESLDKGKDGVIGEQEDPTHGSTFSCFAPALYDNLAIQYMPVPPTCGVTTTITASYSGGLLQVTPGISANRPATGDQILIGMAFVNGEFVTATVPVYKGNVPMRDTPLTTNMAFPLAPMGTIGVANAFFKNDGTMCNFSLTWVPTGPSSAQAGSCGVSTPLSASYADGVLRVTAGLGTDRTVSGDLLLIGLSYNNGHFQSRVLPLFKGTVSILSPPVLADFAFPLSPAGTFGVANAFFRDDGAMCSFSSTWVPTK